jgi:hypothetical protein
MTPVVAIARGKAAGAKLTGQRATMAARMPRGSRQPGNGKGKNEEDGGPALDHRGAA